MTETGPTANASEEVAASTMLADDLTFSSSSNMRSQFMVVRSKTDNRPSAAALTHDVNSQLCMSCSCTQDWATSMGALCKKLPPHRRIPTSPRALLDRFALSQTYHLGECSAGGRRCSHAARSMSGCDQVGERPGVVHAVLPDPLAPQRQHVCRCAGRAALACGTAGCQARPGARSAYTPPAYARRPPRPCQSGHACRVALDSTACCRLLLLMTPGSAVHAPHIAPHIQRKHSRFFPARAATTGAAGGRRGRGSARGARRTRSLTRERM